MALDHTDPETPIRLLAANSGFFTLIALCRAAGIQRVTLRDLIRGQRRASARTIRRLATALEVPESVVRATLGACRGA